MLEVYTHASLGTGPGAVTADEHGGSARLAILGERVLESAVMTILFWTRPMYSANQLEVGRPSTVVIAAGHSDMWWAGIDRRVCLRVHCRSVGNWIQPEE